MKYAADGVVGIDVESHPSRGAWVEIMILAPTAGAGRSHPSRGAWVEMPRRL